MKKQGIKYVLLIPVIIFWLMFTAWPLFEVVRLSLYKTNFITSTFIGINNYISAFSDQKFIQSIFNSMLYIAVMVPCQILLSVGSALFIFRLDKGWQDAARIIFYIPTLSAGIIIAQSWKWIFHINGPINWLIGLFGITPINFFGSMMLSISVISFIVLISGFGANMILVLAAIQAVPKEYMEAAVVDGASWWKVKTKIIVPIIMPTIVMIAILTTISAMQIFENIYALAPYDYSATMTYDIYVQGFKFSKYGLASAEAIILLIITVLLSLLKRKANDD